MFPFFDFKISCKLVPRTSQYGPLSRFAFVNGIFVYRSLTRISHEPAWLVHIGKPQPTNENIQAKSLSLQLLYSELIDLTQTIIMFLAEYLHHLRNPASQEPKMEKKIHKVEFRDEFRVCPVCSYQDGFHTMLKRDKGEIKRFFICPSCHEIFDLNLSVKE